MNQKVVKIHIFVQILSFFIIFLLSGCQESRESSNRKLLEGIKLSDLSSSRFGGALERPMGYQGDFLIIVFEVPAGGYSNFEKVKTKLRSDFLTVKEREANAANGLYFARGSGDCWPALMESLEQAGARMYKRIDLLVFDSKGDVVPIKNISESKDYFYKDVNGNLSGYTMSAGELCWNIIVDDDYDLKDTLKVSFEPAVRNGDENVYKKLMEAGKGKAVSVLGKGLGMGKSELVMSPGDFFVAAADNAQHEVFSPASLIFSADSAAGKLRVYVLLCRSIQD